MTAMSYCMKYGVIVCTLHLQPIRLQAYVLRSRSPFAVNVDSYNYETTVACVQPTIET